MKYLLIIHNNPALMESLPPAELDAIIGAHGPFQEATRASGELVGFAALADPAASRVVRVDGGVPAVTDGPFIEAKEHLAGFYVVDCESDERAYELAAQMPEARYAGVEVRPLMAEAGLEM
ncbi:MAG TPA: YciI family protein [Mycobacteriales bacterium]|nr:YciI family protein [Mycobacteriales bacterium]